MRQLINSKTMNLVALLLILMAIAKFIALCVLYFLPQNGIESMPVQTGLIKYRNYKVSNIFDLNTSEVQTAKPKPIKNTLKIDNLVLYAIYGDNKKGFIVFAEKSSSGENHILALNETYEGYKLIRIRQNSAILEKDGKNYELLFKESENKLPIQERISAPVVKSKDLGNTDVLRAVRKKDVMHYAKNFDEIWKNIAITEVKKDGKINGFKVMSVKQSSIFGQLGLLQGDVIMSVNNQELKSYADAFKIYNNIDDYDSLKLVIIRNKQKKELEYEVF